MTARYLENLRMWAVSRPPLQRTLHWYARHESLRPATQRGARARRLIQACFTRAGFGCGLPLTRRRLLNFRGRSLYPRHNNESDTHTLTTAVGMATTRGQ